MAVDVLRSKGVPEDRILFLNLIASPEGAMSFAKKYPKLRVVTAFVDEGLDDKKYVIDGSNAHSEYTLTQRKATSSLVLAISATGSIPYSSLYALLVKVRRSIIIPFCHV